VVSADPLYQALANQTVTANVFDNDTSDIIATPATGSLTVTEGGNGDTVNVHLNSQPTSNVVLNVTFSPNAQAPATPVQLTFTPANWDVDQPVAVAAVDDPVDENSQQTITITFAVDDAQTADTFYQGVPNRTLNVSVVDNDVAAVRVDQLD